MRRICLKQPGMAVGKGLDGFIFCGRYQWHVFERSRVPGPDLGWLKQRFCCAGSSSEGKDQSVCVCKEDRQGCDDGCDTCTLK